MSPKVKRRLMIAGFFAMTVAGIGLGIVTGGLIGLTFTFIGAMSGLVSVVGLASDLHYSSLTASQQRRHDEGIQRFASSYRRMHDSQPAIMQAVAPEEVAVRVAPPARPSLWARFKAKVSGHAVEPTQNEDIPLVRM